MELAFYPQRYGTVFYKEESMGLSLLTMYKTPYEAFKVTVDFSSVVTTGQLAVAAVYATDSSTGLNITSQVIAASPAPVVSGTGVVFQVQAGALGQICMIGVQVTNTNTGELFEGDVTLVIQ